MPFSRRRRRSAVRLAVLGAALAFQPALVACTDGSEVTGSLARLRDLEPAVTSTGDDQWEVFVCRVPVDTVDPLYEPVTDRLPMTVDELTDLVAPVTDYFERWSANRYRPRFVAGGEVTIGSLASSDRACIDAALAESEPDSNGVLVVADASHRIDVKGGWGTPGRECSRPPCSARDTGRAVYVGAADFVDSWGDRPPLDLVEHEMGHAIGWPHSSTVSDETGSSTVADDPVSDHSVDAVYEDVVYDSVIDVMSDSAAPRDAEPSSRNAPGALAVNRFLAGWLDDDDVVDLSAGGKHSIVGGDGDVSGPRLATVDLTMDMFLTVEVVTPGVDNVHISSAGVAVHVIDFSDGVCELPPCVGTARRQGLLVDTRRSDGLLETGSVVEFGGVRVQVGAMRTVDGVTRAEVTVRRVA